MYETLATDSSLSHQKSYRGFEMRGKLGHTSAIVISFKESHGAHLCTYPKSSTYSLW